MLLAAPFCSLVVVVVVVVDGGNRLALPLVPLSVVDDPPALVVVGVDEQDCTSEAFTI